jgi:hypothetical protein
MRGCTYFIGSDTGPVKIGRTTNLQRRVAELQSGSPVPLRIFGVVELDRLRCDGEGDPPTFEVACHRMLTGARVHGEWFDRRKVEWLWSLLRIDQTDQIVIDNFGSIR